MMRPETKLFSIQNVIVFNKFNTSIKYQSFKYLWKANVFVNSQINNKKKKQMSYEIQAFIDRISNE